MKSHRCLSVLTVILTLLTLVSLSSAAYQKRETEPKKESKEAAKVDLVLPAGSVPVPLPSRRQIIDADKGTSCLLCHRMPYPTAPQKPAQLGEQVLSSIQVTPPCAWQLLTTLPFPFNKNMGAWSPDGKRIVYSVSVVQGDWDIWLMDADGKNRTPLLTGATRDVASDWSPDGRYILFQSNRSGNDDIWMMELASQKLTQITRETSEETHPRCSPDGKKIVFQSNRSGNQEIWAMEVASRQWTQLTNHPGVDESPAFSPSGDQIVFVSDRAGNKDIWIMNSQMVAARRR